MKMGPIGHISVQAYRFLCQAYSSLIPMNQMIADDEFFEYLKKSIMKLFTDAAPVKGRWVVIKCDSSPGRLNPTLLAYLR
jgi:hypothetical protein